MNLAKKKKQKESIRNDLEKEIMYGFKEEFLQQSVKLLGTYKVDRGKILKSWIEGGLLDTSDIKRNILKSALSRVGVVIYKRASPKEKPYIIFFVDGNAKRSTIDDAEEAARVFKRLFPGVLAAFAGIDEEPEPIRKSRYKHLDAIIVGRNLEEAWDGVYKFLEEIFGKELES